MVLAPSLQHQANEQQEHGLQAIDNSVPQGDPPLTDSSGSSGVSVGRRTLCGFSPTAAIPRLPNEKREWHVDYLASQLGFDAEALCWQLAAGHVPLGVALLEQLAGLHRGLARPCAVPMTRPGTVAAVPRLLREQHEWYRQPPRTAGHRPCTPAPPCLGPILGPALRPNTTEPRKATAASVRGAWRPPSVQRRQPGAAAAQSPSTFNGAAPPSRMPQRLQQQWLEEEVRPRTAPAASWSGLRMHQIAANDGRRWEGHEWQPPVVRLPPNSVAENQRRWQQHLAALRRRWQAEGWLHAIEGGSSNAE